MSVRRRAESPHDAQSSLHSPLTVTKGTHPNLPGLVGYFNSRRSQESGVDFHGDPMSPTKENHSQHARPRQPNKKIIIDESSAYETEAEDVPPHSTTRHSQRRRRAPRRLGAESDEERDQVGCQAKDANVKAKEKGSVAQGSQLRVRATEPLEAKNAKRRDDAVPSGAVRKPVAQNVAGAMRGADGLTRINGLLVRRSRACERCISLEKCCTGTDNRICDHCNKARRRCAVPKTKITAKKPTYSVDNAESEKETAGKSAETAITTGKKRKAKMLSDTESEVGSTEAMVKIMAKGAEDLSQVFERLGKDLAAIADALNQVPQR